MLLTLTTSKIQAVMSGAAATTNPTYCTVAIDSVGTPVTSLTGLCARGSLNGSTAVDIVAAPTGSTHQVGVKSILIYNGDTASVQITIRYNDNGTLIPLAIVALAIGQTLCYSDTGQFFTIDANGNIGSISSGGTGRINRAPQFSTTTGTYTTVAGTTAINVCLQAGGGGGGGVTSVSVSAAAGGGGAAGQFAEKYFNVQPITGYSYTIGALGTAGANTGGTGGAGSNTSFGAVNGVTAQATGGSGGVGMAAGTAAAAAAGGAQTGLGSSVDWAQNGMPGGYGIIFNGTVGIAGEGGTSPFGSGGQNANVAINSGQSGNGNGSGGAGALCLNGGGAKAGGSGTKGALLVQEYT